MIRIAWISVIAIALPPWSLIFDQMTRLVAGRARLAVAVTGRPVIDFHSS
jgi:hypothetical protein